MNTGTRIQALRNDTEIAESTPEIVYMLNKYATLDKGEQELFIAQELVWLVLAVAGPLVCQVNILTYRYVYIQLISSCMSVSGKYTDFFCLQRS